MGHAAAVAWGVALAVLVGTVGVAEVGAEGHDLLGLAVAVLAAGLVLSARLGAVDVAGPSLGVTDYT
jgi:hypothetical protein